MDYLPPSHPDTRNVAMLPPTLNYDFAWEKFNTEGEVASAKRFENTRTPAFWEMGIAVDGKARQPTPGPQRTRRQNQQKKRQRAPQPSPSADGAGKESEEMCCFGSW